jgi:predicted O-methyltransferase YrrM
MKPDQAPSFDVAVGLPSTAVCVEVGTWQGEFSKELLERTVVKRVYCVDPYKKFDESEYPDAMNNLTQEQFDAKFELVKKNFSKYGKRVEFLRMTSTEAAKTFEDESIDYVYIDANHDYKHVLEDIRAWYPKVKVGGYMCGDDVHSTSLAEHEEDGNVTRVWSRGVGNAPACWGKYGVFKALVDAKQELNYDYKIVNTQFIVQKAPPALDSVVEVVDEPVCSSTTPEPQQDSPTSSVAEIELKPIGESGSYTQSSSLETVEEQPGEDTVTV